MVPEQINITAGATIRGLFASRKAKKFGAMIKADLEEKGYKVIPIEMRVGFTECLLTVQITCDKSAKQPIKEALSLLGMDFIDSE